MKRLFRFIKALWRYILYGNKVGFVEYVSRLDECCLCGHFGSRDNPPNPNKWICSECGCYVTKKAKMSTEKCPIGKW